MKYIFLFLIFSLTMSGQVKKADYKLKLTDFFNCIKTGDKKKFSSMLIKENEFNTMYQQAMHIEPANKKANKEVDPLIHLNYLKTIKESTAQFEKVITNSKTLRINWANAVLDSIIFKTQTKKNSSFVDGKIYFKIKDNSAFYFMNLIDFGFYDLNFMVSKLYSPAEDLGPKNRFLTKDIKEEYITNLSKLMHENRKWAEEAYIGETNKADGVEKVKFMVDYCKKQLAKK